MGEEKFAPSDKPPYGHHFHPEELTAVVKKLKYKKGWSFYLDFGSVRYDEEILPLLTISVETIDSNDGITPFTVSHYLPVPPAMFNEKAWARWVFDRILDIEKHEAMEFFQVGRRKPYIPDHRPGTNPYVPKGAP